MEKTKVVACPRCRSEHDHPVRLASFECMACDFTSHVCDDCGDNLRLDGRYFYHCGCDEEPEPCGEDDYVDAHYEDRTCID